MARTLRSGRRGRPFKSDHPDVKSIKYNILGVGEVLGSNKIKKIFFTSRFVENKYRRVFKEYIEIYPNIELITLPSPSPRYAKMFFKKKVEECRKLLLI